MEPRPFIIKIYWENEEERTEAEQIELQAYLLKLKALDPIPDFIKSITIKKN